MDKIINVLIADEQSVVRAGLRFAFSGERDIRVIDEASDGVEAESKAFKLKPDVIIADLSIPCRSGLELLKNVKSRLPEVKVLLFTVSESESDLLNAIHSGADGYLSKKNDISEIVRAIRRIMAHEPALSPQLTVKLAQGVQKNRSRPQLSSREIQVLQLLREGLTTSEIAERLFVSSGTVSTYIHRLLQKLKLKNRAQAMAYILRQGI